MGYEIVNFLPGIVKDPSGQQHPAQRCGR